MQSFRFLFRYARPYLGHYGLGLVFLYATNYIVVRIPELIGKSLDVLQAGGAQALGEARDLSIELIVLALLLVVVRTLSRILFFNPGRDVEYELCKSIFAHVLTLQRPFFARRKLGEIVSIATSDTQSVRLLVGFAGLQICNVAFALPMHVYQMWRTDAVLTLYCLVPVALGSFYLYLTVRRFYGGIKEIQAQIAVMSSTILESYSGIATLRSHVADAAALERFDRDNDRLLDMQLKVSSLRSFSLPALAYSGLLAMGLVLWFGGQRVITNEAPIGSLATMTTLLGSLVSVMTNLVWVLVAFSRGTVSLARVQGIMNEAADLPPVRSEVDFRQGVDLRISDLSFCYPKAPEPALRDISIDVPAGKTLGVFGKTGAGKTSLIELLVRVNQPPDQSIFVNGHDINGYDLAELRAGLTVVPQDPFLFSATLRENIRMIAEPTSSTGPSPGPEVRARGGSTAENAAENTAGGEGEDPYRGDALLREVVRAASLDKDLEALPEGLDTVVGERGVMLSGGQRQRAAFARALYRKPKLLLLDDVLSAVDQRTEARMVAAIADLHDTKRSFRPTTVIVSHRTRVLEHVDEIVVLEKGRIVERGDHDTLVKLGGLYAAAHAHQSQSRRQRAGDDQEEAAR